MHIYVDRARIGSVSRDARRSLTLNSAAKSTAVAFGLYLCIGCGESAVAVHGHVTADGKSVSTGAISLAQVDGARKTFGASVHDGEFAFGQQPGLVAGIYQATLDGFQNTGRMINDVQRGPIPETMPLTLVDNSQRVEITSENAGEMQLEFHSR